MSNDTEVRSDSEAEMHPDDMWVFQCGIEGCSLTGILHTHEQS
jgi:hypothetical protein